MRLPGHFLFGQSINVGPRQVNGQWFEFVPLPAISYNLTTAQIGTDSCSLPRPTSGPLALPACGTLGNARFNSFTGPSGFSDDFALTKNFTITERVQAQFRFDAYNLFNHPILGFNSNQGNTCLDCGGSAGKITDIQADASPGSANGMRQLQFGVRLVSNHN